MRIRRLIRSRPTFGAASIVYSSSWIRPRTSSATVCTRPLSFHGSSPHWSVAIGSRKRMWNFAGRYAAPARPSHGNSGVTGK